MYFISLQVEYMPGINFCEIIMLLFHSKEIYQIVKSATPVSSADLCSSSVRYGLSVDMEERVESYLLQGNQKNISSFLMKGL